MPNRQQRRRKKPHSMLAKENPSAPYSDDVAGYKRARRRWEYLRQRAQEKRQEWVAAGHDPELERQLRLLEEHRNRVEKIWMSMPGRGVIGDDPFNPSDNGRFE